MEGARIILCHNDPYVGPMYVERELKGEIVDSAHKHKVIEKIIVIKCGKLLKTLYYF